MSSMKGHGSAFKTNAFRAGSYSTFAAVIVLAIAIAINVAVSYLPSTVTEIDISGENLFTTSEKTSRILTALDTDVTIFMLSSVSDATASNSTDLSRISHLLDRYRSLSDHVKVEYIDPSVYPRFASTYTSDVLARGSLIVVCERTGRSRAVSFDEIIVQTPTYTFSSRQGEYVQTGTKYSFNGEDVITSAVNYVSSEDMPVVYILAGHGEKPLSEKITQQITYDNFEMRELNLISEGAIPDDCGCIIINVPQKDLNSDETKLLINFMRYYNGDVILLSDFIAEGSMPNLLSMTESMGLTAVPGMLFEADQSRYVATAPYYLLPELAKHIITFPLIDGSYSVLMPYCQGLYEKEGDNVDAQVTYLMQTSSGAYAKAAGYSSTTTDPEASDLTGVFYPAAVSLSPTGRSHFAWFSSAYMLEDPINELVSGANLDVFMNTLNWACEREQNVAISAKSLDSENLVVTGEVSTIWTVVYMAAVPLTLLIVSGIIIFRRKRR